jgi:hypothetical protein
MGKNSTQTLGNTRRNQEIYEIQAALPAFE